MLMIFTDRLPPVTLENRDRAPIPHWEASDATSLEEMILPGKWPTVASLRHAWSHRVID